MGVDCHHRLHSPASRAIYEECGDYCSLARLAQGVAQRPQFGTENADLFHQSSGAWTECSTADRTTESEDVAFEAYRTSKSVEQQEDSRLILSPISFQ